MLSFVMVLLRASAIGARAAKAHAAEAEVLHPRYRDKALPADHPDLRLIIHSHEWLRNIRVEGREIGNEVCA